MTASGSTASRLVGPSTRGILTKTGSRFQVAEGEDAMTGRASKVAMETPIAEPLASHRQLNRALELMSDELFLPMYERR